MVNAQHDLKILSFQLAHPGHGHTIQSEKNNAKIIQELNQVSIVCTIKPLQKTLGTASFAIRHSICYYCIYIMLFAKWILSIKRSENCIWFSLDVDKRSMLNTKKHKTHVMLLMIFVNNKNWKNSNKMFMREEKIIKTDTKMQK